MGTTGHIIGRCHTLFDEQNLKAVRESEKVNSECNDSIEGSGAEVADIDSGLIRKLYELHWQDLCNYLKSRFKEGLIDPEDIAQLAFIRFSGRQDTEKIKNPQAFLFAVARNIAIDEFRKSKIRLAHQEVVQITHVQEINDDLSPENVLIKRQKIDLMVTSIKKLPKIQRAVLLSHRLDKLTYSQIASKIGLSESTIRRYVAKAVEHIHRDLKRVDEI